MFSESYVGKIYYKVREIPVVKLFFDFEYALKMWNESCIKNLTKRILSRFYNKIKLPKFRLNKNIFIVLLGFCPFLGLWTDSFWHIFLLTVFLTACFLLYSPKNQLGYVIFYEAILTVLFAPFIRIHAFEYIIYVETAVILFFIVKNLSDGMFDKLLKIVTALWFFQCIFPCENAKSALISFLPYALCLYGKNGAKRYLYMTLALSFGLYAISALGKTALLGGGISILLPAVLGEWRLFIPILLISPWIAGIGLKIVREGLSGENIIRTGYFFWSKSFKGVTPDYRNISQGNIGIFVSLFFSVISFIFFWYVLRVSRHAVLKLFDKNQKNKRLLRAGLGCVIGFSLYTFLSKTGSLKSNILIYLWNCAMLKRLCSAK